MSKARMIFYGVLGSLISVMIWSFIGGCHSSSESVSETKQSAPAPAEEAVREDRESRETLVREGIITSAQPSIPVRPAALPSPVGRAEAPAASLAPSEEVAGRVHTVKRGDTLWGISRLYGVSARSIEEANSLADPGRLAVGQRLVIP